MATTKLHNIKLKYAIYMCNYGFSSVKPLSQKSLETYSLCYQNTTLLKVKAYKEAGIKCGNVKSGIGGSKLLTRVFILWFG